MTLSLKSRANLCRLHSKKTKAQSERTVQLLLVLRARTETITVEQIVVVDHPIDGAEAGLEELL